MTILIPRQTTEQGTYLKFDYDGVVRNFHLIYLWLAPQDSDAAHPESDVFAVHGCSDSSKFAPLPLLLLRPRSFVTFAGPVASASGSIPSNPQRSAIELVPVWSP